MNNKLVYTKSSAHSQWYETTLIDLVKWIDSSVNGNATLKINGVKPSSLDAVAVGSGDGTVIESLSFYPADKPNITVNEWETEIARCIADGKLKWNSIIHFTRIGIQIASDRYIQFPKEEYESRFPIVNITLTPPNEGRYKKFFRTPENHESDGIIVPEDPLALPKILFNDGIINNGYYHYSIGHFTNMICDKLLKYADDIQYEGNILKTCRVVINGFPNLNLDDVSTFLIPSTIGVGNFSKCAFKLECDDKKIAFGSFIDLYHSAHYTRNTNIQLLMDSYEVKLTEPKYAGFEYDLLIDIKYHDYNDIIEGGVEMLENRALIPNIITENRSFIGEYNKYKLRNFFTLISNKLLAIETGTRYDGHMFEKTRVLINGKPSKPLDRLFIFKYTTANGLTYKLTDTLEYYDEGSTKHDFMSFKDYYINGVAIDVFMLLDDYKVVLVRSADPENYEFDLRIDLKYHDLSNEYSSSTKSVDAPAKMASTSGQWSKVFEDHSSDAKHYKAMPMSVLLNNAKAYAQAYYKTATNPDLAKLTDEIDAFKLTINHHDPEDPRFLHLYDDKKVGRKVCSLLDKHLGRDNFTYENYVDMFSIYCEEHEEEYYIPYKKIVIQVNKDYKNPAINIDIDYYIDTIEGELTYENS